MFATIRLYRKLKRYVLADVKNETSELSVIVGAGNTRISSCIVITNTAFANSAFEKTLG
jgi:hypothetical protein